MGRQVYRTNLDRDRFFIHLRYFKRDGMLRFSLSSKSFLLGLPQDWSRWTRSKPSWVFQMASHYTPFSRWVFRSSLVALRLPETDEEHEWMQIVLRRRILCNQDCKPSSNKDCKVIWEEPWLQQSVVSDLNPSCMYTIQTRPSSYKKKYSWKIGKLLKQKVTR